MKVKSHKKYRWKPGDISLKSYGFKVDDEVYDTYHSLNHDLEPDFYVNTHARSGDFLSLLDERVDNVKEAADGKEIWALPEPEMYFSVSFMFGEHAGVLKRIKNSAKKVANKKEKGRFKEKLLYVDVLEFARMFRGRPMWDHKETPCEFIRNDGHILNFYGVAGHKDIYDIGPQATLSFEDPAVRHDAMRLSADKKRRIYTTKRGLTKAISALGDDLPEEVKSNAEIRWEKMRDDVTSAFPGVDIEPYSKWQAHSIYFMINPDKKNKLFYISKEWNG